MRHLMIYGGTFDPIHNGHLKTAINIQDHFNFDRFVFLPCKTPLLKNKSVATAAQRIDMLELALAYQDKHNNFAIDLSEINRATPSYMVESLYYFRSQYGDDLPITLLMGADTFYQLPQWHAWQQLIKLANVLVIKRAGFNDAQPPELISELLYKHETKEDKAIGTHAQGVIYRYDAGSYNFSSTWIRQQLKSGKNLQDYLPMAVIQYIKKNNLYS